MPSGSMVVFIKCLRARVIIKLFKIFFSLVRSFEYLLKRYGTDSFNAAPNAENTSKMANKYLIYINFEYFSNDGWYLDIQALKAIGSQPAANHYGWLCSN